MSQPQPSPEAMRAAEALTKGRGSFKTSTYRAIVESNARLIDDAFRPLLETLKIDSGNYRGKCAVCMTANCDMLTDGTCVACERDALRESHERLRVACERAMPYIRQDSLAGPDTFAICRAALSQVPR